MPSGKSKLIYAFAFSFAVYLFPLVGPHIVTFLGQGIWQDLVRGERERLWIAIDTVFALALQLIAFVVLFWLFRKPSKLRVVLIVVAVPIVAIAVEFAYLIYIPSYFLIEDDTAVEKTDWPLECSVQDVALVDVPHPSGPAIWSEFLVQAPEGSYKLMKLPGCELVPFPVPQPKLQPGGRVDFTIGLNYFVPGHGVIFSRQETATGEFSWNVFSDGHITAIPGLPATTVPILSTDGKWVAWLAGEHIEIKSIEGSEKPKQIAISQKQTWSYMLRTVDMEQGEVELRSSDRQITFDLNGNIKSPGRPPLVWDAYREDGPPRVSWVADGHPGTHTVLKGRLINSAAMPPSGDLIAVSVATGLNIGHIRDSIYVLRASDGSEVFRRYLPMYIRTPVFFPTDDQMVYTADRQVRVLRVPKRLP